MNITLEIPDNEMATLASGNDAAPLKHRLVSELAFTLYRLGKLPVGKAMELAGLTRREFHEMVHSRGVERPFDKEELRRELQW
ncbi:MAG: UPF0175 family protein [Verrucomicrobiaceae bacterium]|nr:UPF0175 family protein [Verrucomicrobiaceae bacterium]